MRSQTGKFSLRRYRRLLVAQVLFRPCLCGEVDQVDTATFEIIYQEDRLYEQSLLFTTSIFHQEYLSGWFAEERQRVSEESVAMLALNFSATFLNAFQPFSRLLIGWRTLRPLTAPYHANSPGSLRDGLFDSVIHFPATRNYIFPGLLFFCSYLS